MERGNARLGKRSVDQAAEDWNDVQCSEARQGAVRSRTWKRASGQTQCRPGSAYVKVI